MLEFNNASILAFENPLDLKSQKAADIVDRLLTRAFNEGRGEEMVQEIARRITKIKNWAAKDAGHIAFCKELDKASMSPTLRLFNLKAKAEGRNEMLYDETGTASQLTKQEQAIGERIASSSAVALMPLQSAHLN